MNELNERLMFESIFIPSLWNAIVSVGCVSLLRLGQNQMVIPLYCAFVDNVFL